MRNQLTNLLPIARRTALDREYRYRVAVVAIVLAITLTIIAGILLLPTYIFLSGSARAQEARLTDIKNTLTSTNEVTISARLASLSSDTKELSFLAARSSPVKIATSMLLIPHSGILLSGFTYKPVQGAVPASLLVTGTAAARDALRAYQLALEGASFVQSANLPVSAYAQDTGIGFTITLVLKP